MLPVVCCEPSLSRLGRPYIAELGVECCGCSAFCVGVEDELNMLEVAGIMIPLVWSGQSLKVARDLPVATFDIGM